MPDSLQLLKVLDKKLWAAADKLRVNLDAAVYKHAVVGLVFLKDVFDAFEIRRQKVAAKLRDENDAYCLAPVDYDVERKLCWVPALARWKTVLESAPLASGAEIEVVTGKKITYKIASIGKLIDDDVAEAGKENPKRNGVLNKNSAGRQLPVGSLIGLINLIAEIPFQYEDLSYRRRVPNEMLERTAQRNLLPSPLCPLCLCVFIQLLRMT